MLNIINKNQITDKKQITERIELEYIFEEEQDEIDLSIKNSKAKGKFNEAKPFVKWAGGKRQLLDSLSALIPVKFNKYHEPFCGGAALFFNINPGKGTINDLNSELIKTYKIIQNNHLDLIKELTKIVSEHNESVDSQAYYYATRKKNPEELSDLEVAARFIYLNKTCFNGLYRVNKAGIFNVPFNKKEIITNSTVFSEENIKAASKMFNDNKVKFVNKDFGYILDEAEEQDFVFIDSPYDQSWTGYQAVGFEEEEHRRLANVVKELDKRGVKFMLTNHNTELIKELYAGFTFFEVPAKRTINSDSKNRTNATTEIIIINYTVTKEQARDFNTSKFLKQLKPTAVVLNELVKLEEIKDNQKLSTADKDNLCDKWFEKKISNIFKENRIEFKREVSYSSIFNTDLYKDKVFDFVFTTEEKTYCIETDYFNTSRTKIISESNRLMDLNKTFSSYPDLGFIWITDGAGLKHNKSKVMKVLKKMENMFNLTTFEEFIKALIN